MHVSRHSETDILKIEGLLRITPKNRSLLPFTGWLRHDQALYECLRQLQIKGFWGGYFNKVAVLKAGFRNLIE